MLYRQAKVMIKRQLELIKNKSFFLLGPRQVGKSTYIKQNFPIEKSLYYDLLLNEEYEKYLQDTSQFRKEVKSRDSNIGFVIIDEVQRVPELLNEVHYLLETLENPPIFILSGSSARKLRRGQANLLGGRALTYHMYPFTYNELAEDFDLDAIINYGSLPGVYFEKEDQVKQAILSSYTETYLQEEIRAEAIVRNIKGFVRFLKLAARENGEQINFSNIARDTGTDRSTVKEFFQVLEDTLIGSYLLPYSKSSRRRLVSHPKFYFFDLGVTNALAKRLSLRIEKGSSEFGRAFEHFLILELKRFSEYNNKELDFCFYRTSTGAEVDLIVETPAGQIFAIEIKAQVNPSLSGLKGLWSFADLEPKAQLICACLTDKAYEDRAIRYLAKRSFAVDVAQKKVATTPLGGSCVNDNSDFRKKSIRFIPWQDLFSLF